MINLLARPVPLKQKPNRPTPSRVSGEKIDAKTRTPRHVHAGLSPPSPTKTPRCCPRPTTSPPTTRRRLARIRKNEKLEGSPLVQRKASQAYNLRPRRPTRPGGVTALHISPCETGAACAAAVSGGGGADTRDADGSCCGGGVRCICGRRGRGTRGRRRRESVGCSYRDLSGFARGTLSTDVEPPSRSQAADVSTRSTNWLIIYPAQPP